MHLEQKVPLKSLHTFGMDVMARYFVEAKTPAEVLTLLNYRHMIHMPILFLGGGSNLLFTGNFPGIVVKISSKGISVTEVGHGVVRVTAEAGENWDDFVDYCVNQGFAGLENLSLIPGTVGAAPIQNIGAYGVEVRDRIESVEIVEVESSRQRVLSNAECAFGYRDSIFKQQLKGRVIILRVSFLLHRIEDAAFSGQQEGFLNTQYQDLQRELRDSGVDDPGPAEIRQAICRIRRRKLPDPNFIGNAGSFFKNPVIGADVLMALRQKFHDLPFYETGHEEEVKIPAAWLIDQCGWKGVREGDAGVHEHQPLVLVNHGNADGRQVLELAGRIRDSIRDKYGITLEFEVNIVP